MSERRTPLIGVLAVEGAAERTGVDGALTFADEAEADMSGCISTCGAAADCVRECVGVGLAGDCCASCE